MNEERSEVEDLFANALSMSAEERTRWLDEACQGNRSLRARVERLLQCHEQAGNFLEDVATDWVDDELQASLRKWSQEANYVSPGDEQGALDTPTDSLRMTTVAPGPRRVGTPFDYQYLFEPSLDPASFGKLGDYELFEIIGRGGMGVVFRAMDTRLHRPVAIKLMEPWLAIDETAPLRFMREAQAAAAVVHDHVVVIHAVSETAGVPYLVMQYVEGPSLQELLAEGPLDVTQIARIGSQIASGLAAAHRRGLIHRDIKPANILLETETQQVKLTDFGLACAIDDGRLTRSGKVTGTPHYMSPEQAQDLPVDARSDLFSLGAVLYAMCTGQSPFQASNTLAALRAVCDQPHRSVREVRRDVPAWLSDVIDRLLAKEPAQRFATAQEVVDALRRSASLGPNGSSSANWESSLGTRSRGRRIATRLAVGLSAIAFVGLLAILYVRTSQGEFVLETDDPSIATRLSQGGGIVVYDRESQREYQLERGVNRLASGDHELLVTTPEGLELTTSRFRLKRGDTVRATIVATSHATGANPDQNPPLERLAWTAPENVGPPINTEFNESQPYLSDDGLSLLFDSDRPGGYGRSDLWESRRASLDKPWGAPRNLGAAINTEHEDCNACLSVDRLTLFFASTRAGGQGDYDLWMAQRADVDAAWDEPTNLGEQINSPMIDGGPALSADGLTVWFHSFRSAEQGSDLWYSQRASRGEAFGPAQNAGETINQPKTFGESSCAIAFQDRVLFWTLCTSVDPAQFDLRMATRADALQPFSAPQTVMEGIDLGSPTSPSLSSDGEIFVFDSHRKDGHGGRDLWFARRVKKSL